MTCHQTQPDRLTVREDFPKARISRCHPSHLQGRGHKCASRERSIYVWVRVAAGFYDRIIRDDTERFFIEQYIALNPLLWHLDWENQVSASVSHDECRAHLQRQYGLDERTADYLAEQIA